MVAIIGYSLLTCIWLYGDLWCIEPRSLHIMCDILVMCVVMSDPFGCTVVMSIFWMIMQNNQLWTNYLYQLPVFPRFSTADVLFLVSPWECNVFFPVHCPNNGEDSLWWELNTKRGAINIQRCGRLMSRKDHELGFSRTCHNYTVPVYVLYWWEKRGRTVEKLLLPKMCSHGVCLDRNSY